ncbi:histidine kinase [Microbacterium sp. KUDC0406]|uniref:sensor histidine kinase n=1 Tax=Microbacterium sp. KUDC0406 TaxID=2909588 RepID=UPI001F298DE7|nr:histidine kinase [Microbacterium sp. KUDC0406]UJP09845.1 histidine kinase [Microbacterium sp. KUDC0406]
MTGTTASTPRASVRLDLLVPGLLTLILLPVSLVALAQQPTALSLPFAIAAGALFVALHAVSFLASRYAIAAFAAASVIMLLLALFPVAAGVTTALYPSALAYLVCVHQVAVRGEWRYALLAMGTAVVGSAVVALMAPELVDPIWRLGAFLGLVAANAAAWAFGLLQRLRRVQAAEQQEARVRAALADERARISAELHDVVAHSLTVMIAQAEVARGFLREQPEVGERALDVVLDSGRDALRGMRGIVRDDAPLQPAEGLESLGDVIGGARSPETRVDLTEDGARRPLAAPVLLALLRVVREGLTNAIRHTLPPRSVRVRLEWGSELTVVIDDDGGSGASGSRLGTGTGLAGLAERVRLVGGTLESNRSGGGWRLRAVLPVEEAR